jgi:beta-glucosidase
VANIVSLMTLDEKIACLGTNPSVPRLGIKGTGHSEGLHGLALGGPGGWGRPVPIPTTQFAQEIGMGETWDPDLIRLAGGVEGYEARYIMQSEKTHRGSLVIRAPNADLGRDPRWGRTEECFGEDPYFNGKMVVAMVKGLAGRRPEVLADGGAHEALPGQQQRGRPRRIVLRFRRPPAARILLRPVPHGRDRRRLARLHGRL